MASETGKHRPLAVHRGSDDRSNILFPVLAVKPPSSQKGEAIIQASCVDVVTCGMRAWPTKWVNTANPAKPVFCSLGVESVGRQVLFAFEKYEVFWCSDQIYESLLRANRAIALKRFVLLNPNLETNTAAVTATHEPHCWRIAHHYIR